MEEVKRGYVIPGSVITSDPYRPEQNVILNGKSIVSTVVGISEIFDGTVRVIPLTGKYFPKTNDLVIGKVTTNTSLSWELDINSSYVGVLPASDVFGRSFSAHADELFTRLRPGDLVAARIANFDRTRDPLVTVSDSDLGKIESGVLAEISPSKVAQADGFLLQRDCNSFGGILCGQDTTTGGRLAMPYEAFSKPRRISLLPRPWVKTPVSRSPR